MGPTRYVGPRLDLVFGNHNDDFLISANVSSLIQDFKCLRPHDFADESQDI